MTVDGVWIGRTSVGDGVLHIRSEVSAGLDSEMVEDVGRHLPVPDRGPRRPRRIPEQAGPPAKCVFRLFFFRFSRDESRHVGERAGAAGFRVTANVDDVFRSPTERG